MILSFACSGDGYFQNSLLTFQSVWKKYCPDQFLDPNSGKCTALSNLNWSQVLSVPYSTYGGNPGRAAPKHLPIRDITPVQSDLQKVQLELGTKQGAPGAASHIAQLVLKFLKNIF